MKSSNLIIKRVLALLIDLVILSQITILLNNFIKLNYQVGVFNVLNFNISYGYSFMFLLFTFYFLIFDFFNNGITFGKKILQISIKSETGKITSIEHFKRTLWKIISICFFPFSLICLLLFNFILQDYFLKNITTIEDKKRINTA